MNNSTEKKPSRLIKYILISSIILGTGAVLLTAKPEPQIRLVDSSLPKPEKTITDETISALYHHEGNALVADIESRIESKKLSGISILWKKLEDPIWAASDEESKKSRLGRLAANAIKNELTARDDLTPAEKQSLYADLIAFEPDNDVAREGFSGTQQALYKGKWVLHNQINPMDDSSTIIAQLRANEGRANEGRADLPILTIQCVSNKTKASIHFDHYLGWDHGAYGKDLRIRVGASPPQNEIWTVSTNHESLFSQNPISLSRKLATSDRLIVQVIPFGENPVTTTFDIKGAHLAIDKIANQCNWTLDKIH